MSKCKYQYEIFETKEYVEDSGSVTSYGISCKISPFASDRGGGDTSKHYQVSNISTQSTFVEALVEKLISHDADPVHLVDLIYDHLP